MPSAVTTRAESAPTRTQAEERGGEQGARRRPAPGVAVDRDGEDLGGREIVGAGRPVAQRLPHLSGPPGDGGSGGQRGGDGVVAEEVGVQAAGARGGRGEADHDAGLLGHHQHGLTGPRDAAVEAGQEPGPERDEEAFGDAIGVDGGHRPASSRPPARIGGSGGHGAPVGTGTGGPRRSSSRS